MTAADPYCRGPTRRSTSRTSAQMDAKHTPRAIARSPTGKPTRLTNSPSLTSQHKGAGDNVNRISDLSIPSPSPGSPTAAQESSAAGYPLKRSPKSPQLFDVRVSESRDRFCGGSRSVSPLKSPEIQQHVRGRSDSEHTSRGETAPASLIPRCPRFHQHADRKSSLSPQPRQKSSSLSSPSSHSVAEKRRVLPATGIASPEGSQRAHVVYIGRKEKARPQLSVDNTPGHSPLAISPNAQSPVAGGGNPSRSSRLPVFGPPSLSPPSQPAPNPPSDSLQLPTTHLPPSPPTESIPIPPRSPQRPAPQQLRPLIIPPPSSEHSIIVVPPPQTKQYSLLSTIKPGVPCVLGFIPLSPRGRPVQFSPPPSPPQTTSPSSVKSPTSSLSSHSFTSIDEQVDLIFETPTTIASPDIVLGSFKARQITMSKPSIAVKESTSSDTEGLEMRQPNRRQLLARLRDNANQDREVVINLDGKLSEDLFVPENVIESAQHMRMARRAELEGVEQRAMQNMGRRYTTPKGPSAQRVANNASPNDPKNAHSELQPIVKKPTHPVDTVHAQVRLKKESWRQKLIAEERRKNGLLDQLQAMKAEVKDVNKRKKEKEAEIDQVTKKIKRITDRMDELEETRRALVKVKPQLAAEE